MGDPPKDDSILILLLPLFWKDTGLSISPLWPHRCEIYSNPKSVITLETGVCSASWRLFQMFSKVYYVLYCPSILDWGCPNLMISVIFPVWPRVEQSSIRLLVTLNEAFNNLQTAVWGRTVVTLAPRAGFGTVGLLFLRPHTSWKGFYSFSLSSPSPSVVPTVKLLLGLLTSPLLRGQPGHYKGVSQPCSLAGEVAVPLFTSCRSARAAATGSEQAWIKLQPDTESATHLRRARTDQPQI